MDQNLDLLLKYPLIKVQKTIETDTCFKGTIFVANKDYDMTIIETSQTKKFELKHLKNTNSVTQKKIKDLVDNSQFRNIIELLDKVTSILATNESVKSIKNVCDVYLKVLGEYLEFTKFFLNLHNCTLEEDLSKIVASVLDEKSREHVATIYVEYSDCSKNLFNLKKFDLPRRKQGEIFKPSDSLTDLFDEFLVQVELLQPYFDVMDEFDVNCTILDPEKPRRKDSYRRIWLGENISCIITVDPFNIFRRPDIRFLGPDRLVDKYNHKLNENISHWSCENGIYHSIINLLGLDDFPKCEIREKGMNLLVEYGECSICFSLRLDDKMPEIICTNTSCEKFYHNQCLYDWLITLNAKRVFNNISGNCPNCERTISCPVLE